MDRGKKELLKRTIIPIFIIIVMVFTLWLHYEAVMQNIFIDYGIEPFDAAGCRAKGFLGLPLNTYGQ